LRSPDLERSLFPRTQSVLLFLNLFLRPFVPTRPRFVLFPVTRTSPPQNESPLPPGILPFRSQLPSTHNSFSEMGSLFCLSFLPAPLVRWLLSDSVPRSARIFLFLFNTLLVRARLLQESKSLRPLKILSETPPTEFTSRAGAGNSRRSPER